MNILLKLVSLTETKESILKSNLRAVCIFRECETSLDRIYTRFNREIPLSTTSHVDSRRYETIDDFYRNFEGLRLTGYTPYLVAIMLTEFNIKIESVDDFSAIVTNFKKVIKKSTEETAGRFLNAIGKKGREILVTVLTAPQTERIEIDIRIPECKILLETLIKSIPKNVTANVCLNVCLVKGARHYFGKLPTSAKISSLEIGSAIQLHRQDWKLLQSREFWKRLTPNALVTLRFSSNPDVPKILPTTGTQISLALCGFVTCDQANDLLAHLTQESQLILAKPTLDGDKRLILPANTRFKELVVVTGTTLALHSQIELIRAATIVSCVELANFPLYSKNFLTSTYKKAQFQFDTISEDHCVVLRNLPADTPFKTTVKIIDLLTNTAPLMYSQEECDLTFIQYHGGNKSLIDVVTESTNSDDVKTQLILKAINRIPRDYIQRYPQLRDSLFNSIYRSPYLDNAEISNWISTVLVEAKAGYLLLKWQKLPSEWFAVIIEKLIDDLEKSEITVLNAQSRIYFFDREISLADLSVLVNLCLFPNPDTLSENGAQAQQERLRVAWRTFLSKNPYFNEPSIKTPFFLALAPSDPVAFFARFQNDEFRLIGVDTDYIRVCLDGCNSDLNEWGRMCVYHGQDVLSHTLINLDEEFAPFSAINAIYLSIKSIGEVLNLMKQFPFSEDRRRELNDVITNGATWSEAVKWTYPNDAEKDKVIQSDLANSLNPIMTQLDATPPNPIFKESWLLAFTEAAPTEFRENLDQFYFIMAVFFTKLSSASVFGESEQSPQTIRYIAWAFLAASRTKQGDQPLFSDDLYLTWKSQLTGLPNEKTGVIEFPCTNNVFLDMVKDTIKKNPELDKLFMTIFPAKWVF